jgi:outer membrane protein assembly factor BamB
VIQIDPATGSYKSQFNLGSPVSLPPVVANSTLYIYDDDARLHAYR